MRSSDDRVQLGDASKDHSDVSIVIDDFDSAKQEIETIIEHPKETFQKPYTRQPSDSSIQKIMEEAEIRKNEFWKLIEEHNACVEKVKQMEKQNQETKPPVKLQACHAQA